MAMNSRKDRLRSAALAIGALLTFAFGVLLYNAVAGRRQTEAGTSSAPETKLPTNGDLRSYPRAGWRLAPSSLEHSVVWLAHIVIMHRDSRLEASPLLQDASWQRAASDIAPSTRDRAEALALATRVAAEVSVDPSRFEDLAKQYSDDVATRDWGGALGPMVASRIQPELLDVLSGLWHGGVSRPVETLWGFHIFRLEPPRPPEWVSGREISISYVGTVNWLVTNPQLPVRARSAAEMLANRLYERASEDPALFPGLMAEYSDSSSKVLGGEIGVWSTTDPGTEGRVVGVLSRLKIGEISRPVDTPLGFRILQRCAEEPARFMAVRRIVLEYGRAESVAAGALTREQAIAELTAIRAALRSDPEQFERYRAEYCCRGVLEWDGARGDPVLIRALGNAAVGDLIGPVEFTDSYTVGLYQRVAPSTLSRGHRAVDSSVPVPRTPEIDDYIRNGDGDRLAHVVRTLAIEMPQRLLVTEASGKGLQRELKFLASRLETGDPEARLGALRHTRAAIYELLGPNGFLSFMDGVNSYLSYWLLQEPR